MSIASLWNDSSTTPYFDIWCYDTPYSVKSHGPVANYYSFPSISDSPSFTAPYLKWTSCVPFIKWYYGKSYPPELSAHFADSRQFAIQYTGKFQAQAAAATFYLAGNGKAAIRLQGTATSATLNLNPYSMATYAVSGLTPDSYYTLSIWYWTKGKRTDLENVFVVTWKDSTLPKQVTLSAGYYVSSTDYSAGVATLNVVNVIDTSLSRGRGKTDLFKFKLPVVASTASVGYKYIAAEDCFEDLESGKKLKKHRMIEYHTGFKDGSTIATMTRFVGQVRSWQFSRDDNNNSVVEVECYDWASFLTDSINTGYPNLSDYIAFGYLTSDPANVFNSAVRAYDGWKLHDVVDDILINSYIDPKTLLQKKSHINVSDEVVTGGYLFDDRNQIKHINLDQPFNFGKPLLTTGEDVDDPYIWQFSVGEAAADMLERVMTSYGFRYGFNNAGNFYAESVNNPVVVKSIDAINFTGDWVEDIDPRSLYGVSKYSSSGNVVATITGNAVEAIFVRGATSGTVHLKLSNSVLGMVATTDYRLTYTDTKRFFDGIDSNVGYNPCRVIVGEDLAYGVYSLSANIVDGIVNINAVMGYDKDYEAAAFTFKSGNEGTDKGVLVEGYRADTNSDDLRNDILVVGKLKGVKSTLAIKEEDRIKLTLNPNNPVSEHVVARALDISSLGSISSINYVGRPLQMMIIEPKIATDDRAIWLAAETIKRYGDNTKLVTANLSIVGNPLVNVNDLIKVKDVWLETLATVTNFWITDINEEHSSNGYTTRLSLEALEPWTSYYKYPTPSLKRFGNNVFYNIKEYCFGVPKQDAVLSGFSVYGVLPTTISVRYTNTGNTMTATQVRDKFPAKGYFKIDYNITDRTNTDLRNYDGITSVVRTDHVQSQDFVITFNNVKSGKYNTGTILLSGLADSYLNRPINMGIDPYVTEEYGYSPAIQFDLLFPGFVKVHILSKSGNTMEILTQDNVAGENEGWVYLDAGRYYYSWGMLDRIGDYNSANSQEYTWGNIKYRVGKDFYVTNAKDTDSVGGYGEFFVSLDYRDPRQEYVKTAKKINSNYINTNLSYAIGEELNIRYESSTEALANDWHSNYYNNELPLSDEYYTGDENDGEGFIITLKNRFGVNRIATVKGKRYIYVYGVVGQIRKSTGEYFRVFRQSSLDALVEDFNEQTMVISGSGSNLYIKPPTIGFITPGVIKWFTEWKNAKLQTLNSMAIAHVHVIAIEATDFAGKKSYYYKALFWMPAPYNGYGINHFGGPNPDGTYYFDRVSFAGAKDAGNETKLAGTPIQTPQATNYGPISVHYKNDEWVNTFLAHNLGGVVIFGTSR